MECHIHVGQHVCNQLNTHSSLIKRLQDCFFVQLQSTQRNGTAKNCDASTHSRLTPPILTFRDQKLKFLPQSPSLSLPPVPSRPRPKPPSPSGSPPVGARSAVVASNPLWRAARRSGRSIALWRDPAFGGGSLWNDAGRCCQDLQKKT